MNNASGARFVGRSDGGLVEAETDLRARVVDIRIDQRGLTRTRGGELGRQVLQAVTRAQDSVRATHRAEPGER